MTESFETEFHFQTPLFFEKEKGVSHPQHQSPTSSENVRDGDIAFQRNLARIVEEKLVKKLGKRKIRLQLMKIVPCQTARRHR
ncbi:carboxylesterase 5A [Anopheles sinensis]|uniref:Carboxylesterase 5A n=1 Tax=Anopheles sinensis TaxID=74873 RepID=A0A084W650_ANOSI|nr:carboxylesterase 5A [Anopheles sinensis]